MKSFSLNYSENNIFRNFIIKGKRKSKPLLTASLALRTTFGTDPVNYHFYSTHKSWLLIRNHVSNESVERTKPSMFNSISIQIIHQKWRRNSNFIDTHTHKKNLIGSIASHFALQEKLKNLQAEGKFCRSESWRYIKKRIREEINEDKIKYFIFYF